jgi:hypothetical protein
MDRRVRRRSALGSRRRQATIARGAVPLWTPPLHAAKEVDDRRITFAQAARDGITPEERQGVPMKPLRQWACPRVVRSYGSGARAIRSRLAWRRDLNTSSRRRPAPR